MLTDSVFTMSDSTPTLEDMFEQNRVDAKKARGRQKWIRSMDRKPRLITLPEEVVSLTGEQKAAFDPIPVRAAIPYSVAYTDVADVDAKVIAWTKKAVLVEVVVEPGAAPQTVWVWANAVRRK